MTSLGKIDATAAVAAQDAGFAGETEIIVQACPAVQLEIGVFFDGTLNNRFNVISGAREDDSYQNALSNPALLYALYKNNAQYDERNACGGTGRMFRSIYVEGPGSTRDAADSRTGYAFGMGETGVEARVLEGFRRVLTEIDRAGGAPHLRKVVLDVFGFSRGAAGARYFVNCIRARRIAYDPYTWRDHVPLMSDREKARLPGDLEVEIRFVGIFDTVAAIGKPDNDDNDPVNVHLNTAQVTHRICHLTAGDEYRRNFRLNRNVPGGGDTHELPGAHSDVGGGYRDPGDRAPVSSKRTRRFVSRAAALRERERVLAANRDPGTNSDKEAVFVDEGWMTATETEGGVISEISRPVPVHAHRRIMYAYEEQDVLDRPWVRIGLSRVALHMMHEAAVAEVDGALLDLPTEDENYVIPPGLRPYVPGMKSGSLSRADRAAVLRNYGHVSMKDGPWYSGDWMGHRPQDGHRRVEYPNEPGKAV